MAPDQEARIIEALGLRAMSHPRPTEASVSTNRGYSPLDIAMEARNGTSFGRHWVDQMRQAGGEAFILKAIQNDQQFSPERFRDMKVLIWRLSNEPKEVVADTFRTVRSRILRTPRSS